MQEEFELTYLVKRLPEGFTLPHESKEILDVYIPASAEHAILRIRKRGEKYEITKKVPAHGTDSSHQIETTIPLTKAEFDELATLNGKRVRKIRHYYQKNEIMYEIDVFQDVLAGLVLVDVEFKSNAEKNAFIVPDWFGVDVTQEKFVAGGVLCGKSYEDISDELSKYGYQKINI
jgi:CYTH domain-containing protein